MGVHLSTQASLAPVSLASTIIGFISFAFTIATFLRVFWQNLQTLWSAGNEVPNILTNLRQELYEERASLRALKRHGRIRGGKHSRDVFSGPELDEVVIRTLMNGIKVLFRRFKKIERPFLAGNEKERRQNKRRRRRGSFDNDDEAADYGEYDYEKGAGLSYGEDEEYLKQIYCNMTLGRRLAWLRHRGEAMALLDAVARIQTRRIARQVGEIAVVLHEYGDVIEDMRHKIATTENRMNRVVGIRRVD